MSRPAAGKVAVLEAVAAGFFRGEDGDPTAEEELIAEAATMLSTLCESILAAGGRVETVVDRRLSDRFALPSSVVVCEGPAEKCPGVADRSGVYGTNWTMVHRGLDHWLSIARSADAAIAIAPEGDGLLTFIAEAAASAGVRAFNCSPGFTHFAGDKWMVADFCRRRGIPHPPTLRLDDWLNDHNTRSHRSGWCLKPRDGVGCVGLLRFRSADSLQAFVASPDFAGSDDAAAGGWIVQPWVEGSPVSRGYIAAADSLRPAAWMRQEFREEDDIRRDCTSYAFVAGRRLEPGPGGEAAEVERRLLEALRAEYPSGLMGWVGVDYVLHPDGRLTLVEINPRLTTSFAAEGNEQARIDMARSLLNLAWPSSP